MPQFNVGNSKGDMIDELWGQSILPLDLGPDGSGTAENPAYLKSVSFGFPNYATQDRAEAIVICDKPQNGDEPAAMIIQSTGWSDSEGDFGPRTYARHYAFNSPPQLDIDTTYYIYLLYPQSPTTGEPRCQPVSCTWGNVYQSGAGILPDGSLEPEVTLQFQAVFESDSGEQSPRSALSAPRKILRQNNSKIQAT